VLSLYQAQSKGLLDDRGGNRDKHSPFNAADLSLEPSGKSGDNRGIIYGEKILTMTTNSDKAMLSIKLRILIGILAIPSLFLAFMIGATVAQGEYEDISYFEVMYSLVGIFAIHIALTGKKYF